MEPLLMLSIGGIALAILVLLFIFVPNVRGGKVEINENEVGLVYKKFAINPFRRNLKNGQLIAHRGEPGYQAYTLATGRHYGYWRWQYNIERVPMTVVAPGRIGLVVAEDGQTRLPHQLLGRIVECQDFQDGRAFLQNGGQRGRQLHILPGGAYRINTKLFTVITADNAAQHGLTVQNLAPYTVQERKIGIVSTLGGAPLPAREVAGPRIEGHDNFQNPQAFIDAGGRRGLQEEYLSPGAYRLNPWFVKVKEISLTLIPPGTVGVVISNVGKIPEDNGALVEPGYKGIQKTPLYPGLHPINSEVMDVAIVPTNPIALDWSNKSKKAINYDANLRKLQLLSKDGFLFEIEVTQVIRIDPDDAPRMIASIGVPKTDEANLTDTKQVSEEEQKYTSIKVLVTKVLEPTIGSHFRNSAQGVDALDFNNERIKRQVEATDYIDNALRAHGVRAVSTLINEIDLPTRLANQLMDRSVAEQELITLQKQRATQQERHNLQRKDTEFAEEMAEIEAKTRLHISQANAEDIRLRERALKEGDIVDADLVNNSEMLGRIRHAAAVAQMNVPQFFIGGGSSSGSTGLEALIMARMIGMEPAQPQAITEQQPQFTAKQIETFIDALGDYVKDGGAENIRNVLLGSADDSQQVKIIDSSSTGNNRLETTKDREDSAGSIVTGRKRLSLTDAE